MINDWENAVLLPTSFGSVKRQKYNTNQSKQEHVTRYHNPKKFSGSNRNNDSDNEMVKDPWKHLIASNETLNRTEEVSKDYGLLFAEPKEFAIQQFSH